MTSNNQPKEEKDFSNTSNYRWLPELLDENLPDSGRLRELLGQPNIEVKDLLLSQIQEWIRLSNPSKAFTKEELLLASKKEYDQRKYDLGQWVYYPWRNTLLHILRKDEFVQVRTNRNVFKIRPEEQDLLSTKRIGVVGLSVGRSVATVMAMERSFGMMRIADMDRLDLSNLNRLKASLMDLGEYKTHSTMRELYELDPYLYMENIDEGIHVDNVDSFFLEGGKLDLVIDECDSLEVKLLLREKAKQYKVPLIMDTSDRGMLDVERHDIETIDPFMGALDGLSSKKVSQLSPSDRMAATLKVLDFDQVSERAQYSIMRIGSDLVTWPQLASAVFLGGAFAAVAARKILLGDQVKSGRYYADVQQILAR